MSLRPYQTKDARAIRAAHRKARRVLYVLPTGGGKTVVAVAVIMAALRARQRVLFLAHRRELINQAAARLIEAGIPADKIGVTMADDSRHDLAAPIQVASIDTIRRRSVRPAADLVIIDEAHRAPADSYRAVVDAYPAALLLGLTATPWRMDGKGLRGCFDVLVAGPTAEALIADGHLARPRIWTVPKEERPDLEGVHSLGGDYKIGELSERVGRRKLVGSIVDHWFKHAEWQRTVVFAVDVAHSLRITKAFNEAEVPAEHLDGTTPKEERDAILARLKSRETWVVCGVGVLTEGWDAPWVKCAVLARPTRSRTLHMQMCGRILRPWEGVTPVLLDHSGNALVHGPPQMVRPLSLDADREKGDAPCKECPECYAVAMASDVKCGECGYEWPAVEAGAGVEEVDGELVEMREAARASVLDSALSIAGHNGFSRDWANMVAAAFVGGPNAT